MPSFPRFYGRRKYQSKVASEEARNRDRLARAAASVAAKCAFSAESAAEAEAGESADVNRSKPPRERL